jgi:predicted amidophosphoribosyltransferase
MAAKFTLPSHLPSIEHLLLCAQCRDVTTTIRELCVKCGHPSVFLLREAIDGTIHVPALEEPDSWIARLLYDLLISEQRARTPDQPGIPAV